MYHLDVSSYHEAMKARTVFPENVEDHPPFSLNLTSTSTYPSILL